MREYIGTKVQMFVEGLGAVAGIVVNDSNSLLYVRGSDGRVTRIVKSKICGFTPEKEPSKYVPFLVLFCENGQTGCRGIRCVIEGEGFKKSDIEAFMEPCEAREASCRCGSKGELRTVSGDVLRDMLANMMFGEYPKGTKHERKRSATGGQADGGKGKGPGVAGGEKPSGG